MDSACPRGYGGVSEWLDDARRLFAARTGALLSGAASPESLLAGFIATDDARAVAAALQTGPAMRPADPPGLEDVAARLGDPGALARLPVGHLVDSFALPLELAPLLALMLLTETDLRFATLFAWLNDDAQRRHLTPSLAARLAGPLASRAADVFSETAPLRAFGMIELPGSADRVLGDRPLRWSDHMARWLMTDGSNGLRDPALAGHLRSPQTAPLAALVDHADLRARLLAAMDGPMIVLTGVAGSGRAAVAVALAEASGRQHLTVDGRTLAEAPDPGRLLRIALRDATLAAGTLIVLGAEALPRAARHAALAVAPCPVILVSAGRLDLEAPHYTLPRLGPERFRVLWRAALGPERAVDADRLAHRFRLPVAEILQIERAEKDAPLSRLADACVERSSTALDALATRVEVRHDWSDLVLPARQLAKLRAIAARATHAAQVYDAWGFGRKLAPNGGLAALFSGPSGSGKTLSAGVIARDLGLPLYSVDLSATVSKYIGETEKNLDRIFEAAEAGNACLFFDEADALFGKRTEVSDAHDRYANIETSYLLQRLESHRGIVILASNHPQNIDEAFARRIHATVEFPMPDAAHRCLLWRTLMPSEAAGEIDCNLLGGRFELSGGAIRNCLLAAAFLAAEEGGAISTGHCIRAVAQEYEKASKPLTRADFGAAFADLRPRGAS